MPYIEPQLRRAFGELPIPTTAGILNYIVTKVVLRFLGKRPDYDRYNAAIGALECAKLEVYRRRLAPYEDGKIAENGDIE